MSRPKGIPKSGGRKKGTPNKRTAELLSVFDDFSYNPARALLQKYEHLSHAEQMKIDLRLMDFSYPKSKDDTQEPELIPPKQDIPNMNPEERSREVLRLKTSMYRESDQIVLGDLKLIAELRPEVLTQFILEMNTQSKVE